MGQQLESWWRDYSCVSTRALALWRIALGLTAFSNTVYYWRAADVFYSPDGVLPATFITLWSPLLLLDAAWQLHVFFACTATACLGLSAGVRGAKWLVPLLTAAYFQRGHMIVTGGHAVLQLAMVLTWFLPVTENWSFECWRKSGSVLGQEKLVQNIGYPLALLQLGINYSFNTVNKLTDSWTSGTAVERALSNPMTAKPLGVLASQAPSYLLEAATYGTLLLEGALPFLILAPGIRRFTHPVAAALMLGLHGMIVLTMEVGFFGWAMLSQIPLLLFCVSPQRGKQPLPLKPSRGGIFVRRVGAALFLYAILLSLGDPTNPAGINRGASRDLLPEVPFAKCIAGHLNLTQGWGMFSHPLSKSYVAVTHAETIGGRKFDPWRYRAANDSEAHSDLPRRAYVRHVFSSYESLILVGGMRVAPFSEWVLEQSPPNSPDDTVERFATWTLNVPSERKYVVSSEEIRTAAGVYPLPLESPLPAKIESFGAWHPERIVDGEVVKEGSHGLIPTGSALTSKCAYVTLHLERPAQVRQVYVQSDAYDHFLIEGTRNGTHFEKLGESEQLVLRHYRSRLVDVNGKDLIAVRLRKLNPRPRSGYLSEVALFNHRQELPPLPVLAESRILANYEQPAAMGLVDDIRGGCPWDNSSAAP